MSLDLEDRNFRVVDRREKRRRERVKRVPKEGSDEVDEEGYCCKGCLRHVNEEFVYCCCCSC